MRRSRGAARPGNFMCLLSAFGKSETPLRSRSLITACVKLSAVGQTLGGNLPAMNASVEREIPTKGSNSETGDNKGRSLASCKRKKGSSIERPNEERAPLSHACTHRRPRLASLAREVGTSDENDAEGRQELRLTLT